MLFMSSQGFHDASSTLIGNAIGDPDKRVGTARAWRYASTLSIVTIFTVLVALLPLFLLREEIGEALSSDSEVLAIVLETLPIVFLSYVLESIQF
mmetsp:Transcript_42567/g.56187  ORF Transcript_42567/g.56187 Transcript_42567/m.56187 type:complete len:95 (+) Transcript_42567:922-1206(+)